MRPSSCTTQVPWVRCLLTAFFTIASAACFGGGGEAWNAPPFSADLFDLRSPSKPPTRIYIGAGKLRLESTEPGHTAAFVLDPQHGTTLVILDQAKTYIDAGIFAPMVTAGVAPMLGLFRPAADGDPCTVWNGTVDQFAVFARHGSGPAPHFTCRSVGSDVVGGRPAHKWTVTDDGSQTHQGPSTVWIDDRLHVISRSVDANAGMEMRNIKEGAPPADLFLPPSGYQKIGITEFLAAVSKATHAPGGATGAAGTTSGDSAGDAQGAAKALEKLKDMMKQP